MMNQASELSIGEVAALLEEYQHTGCNEAATALLLHYEPIVKMASGKLSRSRPDLYEDLYQIGQMSMLRLFKQYDPSREIPFEGYAMKSVIGHLKNYLRDKSWYIQVPRRMKEKGLSVQKTIDDLTIILGRSPRMEEIAEDMGLSVEETIEVLTSREAYHYVSLDTPLTAEGESAATVGDMIENEADDMSELASRIDLQEAMAQLKEQERIVLTLVYHNGYSQREIADHLGVSQMSVSRLQRRAIDKLQAFLAIDAAES